MSFTANWVYAAPGALIVPQIFGDHEPDHDKLKEGQKYPHLTVCPVQCPSDYVGLTHPPRYS
jgi:hypothetical protein